MEETIMGGRDTIVSRMLSELPYLSSPLQVVDVALDLAELDAKDVFADLGCGEGDVLLRVAEKYGVFSVGFELDYRLINIARRRIRDAGLNHMINLVQADLFRVDLSRFKVIYVYPFPSVVKGLTIKLLDECPHGTRILVHDHPLEGLKPLKSKSISSGKQHVHAVYLYVL